jgi:CheY-like chemotaxis protein
MNKSILLVDDDMQVLISTSLLLESMGFKVKTVEDATEALNILKKEGDKFDIVLLDIMMPAITGDMIMEEVQEDIKKDKYRVIIQSGQMDDDMMEKIFRLGAKDYISKPYNYSHLKNTLHKYL